jgi:hypothetical protein
MASAFDEFVKRKTAPKRQLDIASRIEKYRGKVTELFQTIEGFLEPFIDDGAISVQRETTSIFEELLGSYEIEQMTIKIGDSHLRILPVGTILFGGIGRVDIVGHGENIMIVLAPKDATMPRVRVIFADEEKDESPELDWNEFVWKIAVRDPGFRYIELEKDSFQDALMSVAG